jgi:hypothetical protein
MGLRGELGSAWPALGVRMNVFYKAGRNTCLLGLRLRRIAMGERHLAARLGGGFAGGLGAPKLSAGGVDEGVGAGLKSHSRLRRDPYWGAGLKPKRDPSEWKEKDV